jgi:hypothetical protein
LQGDTEMEGGIPSLPSAFSYFMGPSEELVLLRKNSLSTCYKRYFII